MSTLVACAAPRVQERVSAADAGEDGGSKNMRTGMRRARQVGKGQQHFILC